MGNNQGRKALLTVAMPVISFLIMLFVGYTMAEMPAFVDVSDTIKDGTTAAAGFFSIVILLAAVKYL